MSKDFRGAKDLFAFYII